MKVQINADVNSNNHVEINDMVNTIITSQLKRFDEHISRIEIHLTDDNGNKSGINDKKCIIEARIEGKNPCVVSEYSDTYERAVTGAVSKVKNSLTSIIERMKEH
jgi:ribosome-associated translation inhibitor RaiA